MPITPYSHIQHTLWQTDDKLGSRDALPERVEAALQAFQALAYDSSFGHWFKFSLFERLWQIISIHSSADFAVLDRGSENYRA